MPKNEPLATKSPKSRPSKHITGIPDDEIRCHHIDAAGRRCRSLSRGPSEPRDELGFASGLCPNHATEERLLHEADAAAEFLFKGIPALNTAAAVNRFMNNLVVLIANNRIPKRNASILAYLACSLLNSINGVHDEIVRIKGHGELNKVLSNALEIIDRGLQCRTGGDPDPEIIGDVSIEEDPDSVDLSETESAS